MSSDILGERHRNRSNKPAWHEIPNIWNADTHGITASQAAREVGGDIVFVKAPISFTIDGVTHISPKQSMVVRKPTHDDQVVRDLGVVGKDWHLHQYHEIAEVLDKFSETYEVETAGVIKQGALMFISFKVGSWEVEGDPMEAYALANLSAKPGISHWMGRTDVRTVCSNTNTAAKSNAILRFSINHKADATTQMKLAADLLAKFEESQQETKDLFTAMAKRRVTTEEMLAIFEAAYPTPKKSRKLRMFEQAYGVTETVFAKDVDPNVMAEMAVARKDFENFMERRAKLRDTCIAQYKAFEPSRLGGTAWAAYNAVTEVADWREGPNAGISSLFGTRADEKARAYSAAATLVA